MEGSAGTDPMSQMEQLGGPPAAQQAQFQGGLGL